MIELIKIEELSKGFGKSPILDKITTSIKFGESCGLVGLNGSWKTTLLRILVGLLNPNSGTVTIDNQIPYGSSARFFKDIGIMLESDGFNGNLTFIENLLFYGRAKDLSKKYILDYAKKYWNNLLKRDDQVKKFSRGQKVQCGMARAFLGNPKILIFDEPTATLDIDGYNKFCKLVKKAQSRGATTIISSHRLDAISDLCESVLFLENGEIIKKSLIENLDISSRKIRTESQEKTQNIIRDLGFKTEEETILQVSDKDVAKIINELVKNRISIYEISKESSSIEEMIKGEN